MFRYKKLFSRLVLILSFGLLFQSCFRKCHECPSFSQKKNPSHVVIASQCATNNNQ